MTFEDLPCKNRFFVQISAYDQSFMLSLPAFRIGQRGNMLGFKQKTKKNPHAFPVWKLCWRLKDHFRMRWQLEKRPPVLQAYSIDWKLLSFSRHIDECLFSQWSSIISFLNLMGLQVFAEDLRGHFKTRLEISPRCWSRKLQICLLP